MMNPSSVPLPSSSRASSTRSGRDPGTEATNASAPSSSREAKRRMGTGKWPTTPRRSSRLTTNPLRTTGLSREDRHRHDEHAGSRGEGESFLQLTDSTLSYAQSSAPSSLPGDEDGGPPENESIRDEGEQPSELFHMSSFSRLESTSHPTVADLTVRLEDRAAAGPRGTPDRGCYPITRTACGVGGSVGDRRSHRLETGPPHRSTDLEAGGTHVPDPPGRSHCQGKTVDDQGRPGAVEPAPLPPRYLREEAGASSSRSRPTTPRQPRTAGPSQSDKRMYDEMAKTYDRLEDNLGALRQIASKKMRRW